LAWAIKALRRCKEHHGINIRRRSCPGTTGERTTVIGVVENRTQVDHAIDSLRRAGFRDNQIGVVARNAEGEVTTTGPSGGGTYAEEGAVAGALTGAGIGGLIGLGVVAGVIPVIGPAIAASTCDEAMATRRRQRLAMVQRARGNGRSDDRMTPATTPKPISPRCRRP